MARLIARIIAQVLIIVWDVRVTFPINREKGEKIWFTTLKVGFCLLLVWITLGDIKDLIAMFK